MAFKQVKWLHDNFLNQKMFFFYVHQEKNWWSEDIIMAIECLEICKALIGEPGTGVELSPHMGSFLFSFVIYTT